MEVEGKSTEGMTIDQAVKVLKGKPGEAVKNRDPHQVATKSSSCPSPRRSSMSRRSWGDSYKGDDSWNFFLDPEKKIAYIRLTSFSRDTTKELRAGDGRNHQARPEGVEPRPAFNPADC